MTRSIHAVFIALAGLGIYGPLTSTCLSQGIPLLGTGGRTVPSQAYDLAQNALASGNFSDALELADALGEHATQVYRRSRGLPGRRPATSRLIGQVRPLRRDLLRRRENRTNQNHLEDLEPEVGRRVLQAPERAGH